MAPVVSEYIKPIIDVLEIRLYEDSMKDEWDEFVEKKSVNGTFLHTRKFFDHNPLNQNGDFSFLFYKKNTLVAVIPAIILLEGDKRILDSHFRATYGGFVFKEGVGIKEVVDIVRLFVTEAKKLKIKEIIIRNPFKILFKKENEVFDYALWYHGFTIRHRELEIAIPIEDVATMRSRYTEGARSGVNKANKIVAIGEDRDGESFWKLLEKNLREKYNCKPTHSYRQFCDLLQQVGNDKIKLFTARYEGEIIAGIVVFLLNGHCLHAQYIGYDINFQSYRPVNALIDHILCWGYKRHFTYFNLGRANEENGKVINYNLFKFKESYGGVGVLRETMQLTF